MNVKQNVLPSDSQGDTAPNPDASSDQTSSRRMAFFIGAAVYALILPGPMRIAGIPLQSYFKTTLGLSPTQVSAFFLIVGLPNCLRWAIGWLSDRITLLGSNRRSYLLISALLAAVLWAIVGIIPQGAALTVFAFAISFTLIAANAIIGGVIVDAGHRFNAVQRFSNVRQIAMNLASVTTPLLGGYLADKHLRNTCIVAASLLAVVALLTIFGLRDDVFQRVVEQRDAEVRRIHDPGFSSNPLWCAMLVSFFYFIAPEPGYVLYLFQVDFIGLTNAELGFLSTIQSVGGLCGILAYAWLSKRIPYRALLVAAIPIKILAALFYFAYRSKTSALVLEGCIGFFAILSVGAIQELAARAAPPKLAASGFALIVGFSNLGIGLARLLGAHLHDAFGLNLYQLLWAQMIMTAAVLVVIPFIPRKLVKEA